MIYSVIYHISVLQVKQRFCCGLPVNQIIDMAILGSLTWKSRWPFPNLVWYHLGRKIGVLYITVIRILL